MSQDPSAGNPTDDALPLVSVVIPIYNAAPTLAAVIDSLLAQTYPNVEVIAIDDGSSDGTRDVLARYGSRIRAVSRPNRGLAFTRNEGNAMARGSLIALMDHDDISMPERIGVQVELMRQRPDVLLCSSEFSAFTEAGPVAQAFASRYYAMLANWPGGITALYGHEDAVDLSRWASAHQPATATPVYSGHVYLPLVQGNFVHPPTVMFRRSLLDICDGFDESLRNMCDWEWLVRVARCGPFAHIDRPLLDYRLSQTQLSGPLHRAEAGRDIVRIREGCVRADPSLKELWGGELRKRHALACLSAADAHADSDRPEALRMLGKALAGGALGTRWFKVLAKVAVPGAALRWWRARRTPA